MYASAVKFIMPLVWKHSLDQDHVACRGMWRKHGLTHGQLLFSQRWQEVSTSVYLGAGDERT